MSGKRDSRRKRESSSDEVGRIMAEQFFAPLPSAPPAPSTPDPGTPSVDDCACEEPDEASDELAAAVRALPSLDALPELRVTASRTPANGLSRVSPPVETAAEKRRKAPTSDGASERCAKARPEHYKVICISMYTDDLTRLDEVVTELKRRGFSRANRSAVLRLAVEQLDLRLARKGL